MKLGFSLYAIMLIGSAFQALFSSDEAAKFIAPATLFWARGVTAAINLVATGLKAYTSKAYSDWQAAKKAGIKTEDTEFIHKQTGP